MCNCQEQRLQENVKALIEEDEESCLSDSVTCPGSLVRCLVGRDGQTLNYVKEQTNTTIYMEDGQLEGMHRVVIQGTHTSDVEKAKQMIYGILSIGCSEMYYSNKSACQVVLSPRTFRPLFLVWDDKGCEMSSQYSGSHYRTPGTDS